MANITGELQDIEEGEVIRLLETGRLLVLAKEERPWVPQGLTEAQWLAAEVCITRKKANLATRAYSLLGDAIISREVSSAGLTIGKVQAMLPTLEKLIPDTESRDEIIARASTMPYNDFRDSLKETAGEEHECKWVEKIKKHWECSICKKRTYINPQRDK